MNDKFIIWLYMPGISSRDGLNGNSVRIRNDPVTVIVSGPHDVTEVLPWEGAASIEHKSGDLLIPFTLSFLRTMGVLNDRLTEILYFLWFSVVLCAASYRL